MQRKRVRVKDHYVSVSWAFYQFRQMLEYKAELNHQRVILVKPKYTSQTGLKCGHIEKANQNKKTHIFCCKNCHYISNDDRIGIYIAKGLKQSPKHAVSLRHDLFGKGEINRPASASSRL